MNRERDQLEIVVESVRASTKYRGISTELVRHIGSQELAKRHNLKEALKATKNKLHQVGGAYLDSGEQYTNWLSELQAAIQFGDRETLLSVCKRIMSHHASTRERLPHLEEFYREIFAHLPPVHSILDVACGLNSLAVPWMPFDGEITYYACDIYEEMVSFLNEWLRLIGVRGSAQVCDVLQSCPTQKVDVALILKAIPCLEQIDKQAGPRLLQAIQADFLVVSFPISSLGGRKKGMEAYYEMHFREMIADENWHMQKLDLSGELVFLVKK
jgi:16S rRNA (guanine(1405)-N(7))-methyltransferase